MSNAQSDVGTRDATTLPGGRDARFVVVALGLSFVLANLDVTVVNVATATIQSDLSSTVSQLGWVINGYVLTYAALLLLAGDLAARFGARRVYVAGVAVFTLASAAAGFAPSIEALIGARVVQGVGAALFQPASLILLAAAFPDPKVRSKMIGLWAAMGAAAAGLGPVIGGLLVGAGGWRVIFWINLPVGLLTVLLARRILPEAVTDPGRVIRAVGHTLVVALLAGAAYALMQGPEQGWSSVGVIAGAAVAVVSAIGFAAWQSRGGHAIYPARLFTNRTFSIANTVGTMLNLGLFGIAFILALLLQVQRGATAAQAGLQMLPMMLMFVIGNVAFSRLAGRTGNKALMVAGMAAAALATIGLAVVLDASTPYWVLAVLMSVANLGLGLASPAMTDTMMSSVGPADTGTAGAMLNVNRQVGSLIGVAIFSGLLANTTNWYASATLALIIAALAYLVAGMAAAVIRIAPTHTPQGAGR
ncbi:DHA2 family efflux MFS transporter permease subunit [Cellulomonas hominis]|uniref:DHA2 family efflux MFS transporter permease subunit n=1 Tax=Cellulomonas hominis TaxID=156981 RepID=UPI001B8DE0C3|nr:DHA2 family efflux MFS transporter permease subunit [Cellulomonas hominis]VTR76000.1 Multidrug resistance protein Stp [Cellulomonas hominis]